MRILFLLPVLALCAFAQTPRAATPSFADTGNLPVQKIGADDLIGVLVYDQPEISRTVRVAQDGTIRVAMVKKPIKAAGKLPADLEQAIVAALKDEQILVDPVVTVSLVESRSRPISVVGAVKRPLTFQAVGSVTLLDAISRAEGLDDDAGPEILVSRAQAGEDGKPTVLVQRISVKALIDAADPEMNLRLDGGEEIRVPEAAKIWVLGNVKKPGSFPLKDSSESSVLKAIAMSEWVIPFHSDHAVIYRREGATGGKNEMEIPLKMILARKSPDVTLMPNDVLYIPDNTKRRSVLTTVEKSLPIVGAISGALIYALAFR